MTREKKLEEAVSLAARIFRTYEEVHRAKTPPATAKALENAALARKMEAALAYEGDGREKAGEIK